MKLEATFVRKEYGYIQFEIPDELLEGKSNSVVRRIINETARDLDEGDIEWDIESPYYDVEYLTSNEIYNQ